MNSITPHKMQMPGVLDRPIDAELPSLSPGWIVTVFNNEVNTYPEVMMILMIATQCTEREAYDETWEIDKLGKSVVHHGSETECQRVKKIIQTIGIAVEVTEE